MNHLSRLCILSLQIQFGGMVYMVYRINNRIIYRGFHPCLDGREKITKPDGRAVKGRWLYGELVTVPMPTKPGASPQMPVLCLQKPEGKLDSISNSTVCACSLSLFSGTWIQQDWNSLPKTQQQNWLKMGRSCNDWKGVPVFEGDILYHKVGRCYFVVTYDLLRGFKLADAATGASDMTWYFGLMVRKGCLWNPPKDFPTDRILEFHKARGAEDRVDAITF